MPIYEYEASYPARQGCSKCRNGFEVLQSLREASLTACPSCGAAVVRRISAPSVGASVTGFDDRAKAAGFHKLKKLGHGEYEKQY